MEDTVKIREMQKADIPQGLTYLQKLRRRTQFFLPYTKVSRW